MMQYFSQAWNDTGLTPLEKLIWLRVCDSGMQQIVVLPLDDWMQWTGCEDVRQIVDAMQSLYDSGRLSGFGVQAPGGLYAKSRFAQELADLPSRARDPNEYRKTQISSTLRKLVFERDKYRCTYCGTHEDLTLDHIHPESKGGETTADNLCTACKSCNSSKGVKTLQEWKGAAQ